MRTSTYLWALVLAGYSTLPATVFGAPTASEHGEQYEHRIRRLFTPQKGPHTTGNNNARWSPPPATWVMLNNGVKGTLDRNRGAKKREAAGPWKTAKRRKQNKGQRIRPGKGQRPANRKGPKKHKPVVEDSDGDDEAEPVRPKKMRPQAGGGRGGQRVKTYRKTTQDLGKRQAGSGVVGSGVVPGSGTVSYVDVDDVDDDDDVAGPVSAVGPAPVKHKPHTRPLVTKKKPSHDDSDSCSSSDSASDSDEEDHKRKCPSRKHRKHKGAVQKPKYVANPAIYGGHTPEENMFQMAGTAGSSSLPATASAGAEDDSDDDADTEADRLE